MIDELDDISAQRKRFSQAVVAGIDGAVRVVIAHWLLFANLISFVFVALPVAAPVLMMTPLNWLGRFIYVLYKPTCHQLPYRSYFLFGDQVTYSLNELGRYLNPQNPSELIGNAELGYKVAFCQRDTAIYASIFLAGLFFAFVRQHLKPLDWRLFLVLIAPMAVDGFSQLFGLRESSWQLRTVTGSLFGIAAVWLIFPYLEREFRKTRLYYLARQQNEADNEDHCRKAAESKVHG